VNKKQASFFTFTQEGDVLTRAKLAEYPIFQIIFIKPKNGCLGSSDFKQIYENYKFFKF
jgi:hypothetical protein